MTLAAWLTQGEDSTGDHSIAVGQSTDRAFQQAEMLRIGLKLFNSGDQEGGLELARLAVNLMADREAVAQLAEMLQRAGRIEEARDSFRRVLYEFSGAINTSSYHQLGICEAQLGDYLAAARLFQSYVHLIPASDVVRYHLGSALASLGRFEDADSVFSRPCVLNISEELTTHTGILNFGLAQRLDPEPFGGRVTTWDRAASKRVLERADLVHVLVCDSRYFNLFAEPVLRSSLANAGAAIGFHVHVVNPDPETQDRLQYLGARTGAAVSISTERVALDDLSEWQKRTYYSCARFLLLPELLEEFGRPILMTDADQLVRRSLLPMLERVKGHDVGLLTFAEAGFNLLSKISASVLVAQSTPGGVAFAQFVGDYLLTQMRNPEHLAWHLDQAALVVAAMTHDAAICALPSVLMESRSHRAPIATAADDNAVFWSVTYSRSENAGKLSSSEFLLYS